MRVGYRGGTWLLLGLLSLAAALAPAAGEDAPPESGKTGAEKTDADKTDKTKKPKIPPFKVSAWCSFRDYLGTQKETKDVDPEKNEETRAESRMWGGFGRRGQWVSLIVEVQNTTEKDDYAGTMSIRLDPSKESTESGQKPYTTTYRQPFEVGPGVTKQYRFSVLCPEFLFDVIEVDILAGGRPFKRYVQLYDLDRSATVPEDLIVVVSENSGAFKNLLPTREATPEESFGDPQRRGRKVAVVQPKELPNRWHDLMLANLVIVDGPPREGLTDEQITALRTYCQAGGQLLISSGEDPARLKPREGQELSLADLAGLKVERSGTLPNLVCGPGYEPNKPDWGLPIVVVTPRPTRGEAVVVRNPKEPLVEMSSLRVGMGAVHFLAFSLGDPLLRGWAGREEIPLGLLKDGRRRSLFSYEDIVDPDQFKGQTSSPWGAAMWGEEAPAIDRQSLPWLRQELDRSFTSDTPVSTPPPMMVASFLLLYLLAAVPLNYLLFGWLKRREAAWLAAPGWAVAFVVAAYLVSYKEGKLTVDEVCVIEAGPLQDHGVAHTFLNVYAPNRGSYDLAFGNEAEPASEVQAATGHLISPEFATRGIIDVLPELNLDQTEEGLLVQDLLIQSRATRRLELVHRVPLGGGVTADVKRDAGGYTLKVLNETPYVLLNSALLMRLDDGATWGAPLGHLQAQMPEALERRLPNERQGAAEAGGAGWKDLQEAFFGQPPTFAKARGQWARERARNLSEYVSKRIPRVGDAVLVGWIDGGMLPVRIDDGKAQDRRGFTLLVLPLPRNLGAGPVRAGFKIQFSGNAELDVDAPVWRNLNAGDGVRLSMQTRADAAILLKLDAPEEIQKIGSPVLEASFHLYAETLEDASAGLPDGKKPRQVPSGYDGTPVVEIQELRGGKPRWRPLTGQAPAMSLTPGQRSQDYRVAIELRQTMKDDDGKITLRISVPKLKVTGTVDNEWDHWPLRMQGFKVRVREKGKQEGP